MPKKLNPESFQTCLDLDNWASGGSNWVAFKMPPMFFGFYWFWPTELGVGLDYGKFPTILCPGIFSSNSKRPFSKAKSSSWRGRTKTPFRDNGEGTVDGRHSCTSWDANNQSQLGIIGCKIDEIPSSPLCATARFLQLCFRNEFMVNLFHHGGMFNHSRHMRRKMFRFSELLLRCRFILGYVLVIRWLCLGWNCSKSIQGGPPTSYK